MDAHISHRSVPLGQIICFFPASGVSQLTLLVKRFEVDKKRQVQ